MAGRTKDLNISRIEDGFRVSGKDAWCKHAQLTLHSIDVSPLKNDTSSQFFTIKDDALKGSRLGELWKDQFEGGIKPQSKQ